MGRFWLGVLFESKIAGRYGDLFVKWRSCLLAQGVFRANNGVWINEICYLVGKMDKWPIGRKARVWAKNSVGVYRKLYY